MCLERKRVSFFRWVVFVTYFCGQYPNVLKALPVAFQEDVLLKDAEIEEILHEFADPLLKAANLSSRATRIFLVSTSIVNAASTIGDTIFVNTGLILECDRADELAAVLAHEIGHLQKHHVITRLGAFEGASKMGLGAMGLGAVLAVLTGNPGPLLLGASAGQHLAERSFFKFTRGQESEADQASFALLKKVGWPREGAVSFMKKLLADRGPLQDSRVVYGQTHPLHEERIRLASLQLKPSAILPLSLQDKFFLMQTKIRAYTLPSSQVRGDFKIQKSPYRSYGEAIGLYREGLPEEALKKLELASTFSPSPYLEELRAQILMERGEFEGAERAIVGALRSIKNPHSTVYVLAAQIKIERGKLEEAREFLDRAASADPIDSQPWHFLSIIYGKQHKGPEADLALAEKFSRLGEAERAKEYAQRALKGLPPKTPSHVRALDLMAQIKTDTKILNQS
jgi:predicted Zn-dependent protease